MAYPQFYPQINPQIYQQPQQSQNTFVSVRGESEARNYPVGFGMSVSFKDETAPYIYIKTMGFSQADMPKFERYRREEEVEVANTSADDLSGRIEAISADIEALKKAVFKKKVKEQEDE